VALQAVANPAAGDYLYFLSGDDNKTYFANTAEEHQKNIDEHCKIKCSTS
jgi:cell division protein YceG involved in septum cleavage